MVIRRYRNFRRIFKWRGYFFLPPLLVMIFCRWSEYENDLILWSFGLSLLALGFVIRVWATKHIGKRVARKYKEGRRPQLVVTGPYSLVRNPLYVGNIGAMAGLTLLSELVWLVPVALAYFFLVYSFVVRYEEYRLSVLFGEEYEIYRQQVPRWIPRFFNPGELEAGQFTWFQSLRGEFSGFASTSAMIFMLLGKEIISSL